MPVYHFHFKDDKTGVPEGLGTSQGHKASRKELGFELVGLATDQLPPKHLYNKSMGTKYPAQCQAHSRWSINRGTI
jgi:hypothetical protein